MFHTNYFCNTCFKTFSEYRDGSRVNLDKRGIPYPKDHSVVTGKCDNTDQTNHLVEGKTVCGGELKVA